MCKFVTEHGVLEVEEKRLVLSSDMEWIESTKHIKVESQEEAEEVARTMHELGGRFSEGWQR